MSRRRFREILPAAILVLAVAAFGVYRAIGPQTTLQPRNDLAWFGSPETLAPRWTLDIAEGHIGPPTENMDSEVYVPSEVRLFLERYEYTLEPARVKRAPGGVLFRQWAGCCVDDVAYWDGRWQYLWFAEKPGRPWRPHRPSEGFAEGLEALLESYGYQATK